MDEIIAQSLQGRTSEEEEALLRRWRDESPGNEAHYQRFASVWRVTRDYPLPVSTRPPAVDAITAEELRRSGERRRSKKSVALKVGLLAAGLVSGFLAADRALEPSPEGYAAGEVVTGPGEMTTVRLQDGTVVRLGPESRLATLAAPGERSVEVEGKAFFAVARDEERPFRLWTASGEARVLGTRFDVEARGGDLRLVVVEGRVALSSHRGREVEVGARQVSHIRAGDRPWVVEVEDVWPLLSWMGRFLAFESTPMSDVGEELERRFGITLIFESPGIARETVSVWFGEEPLEGVVSVLCRLMEARCVVEESAVRMFRGT